MNFTSCLRTGIWKAVFLSQNPRINFIQLLYIQLAKKHLDFSPDLVVTPSSSASVFHMAQTAATEVWKNNMRLYFWYRFCRFSVQEVAEILDYEYYLDFLLDSTGLSPVLGEFCFFVWAVAWKFSRLYLLCHVEKVKNEVRRKSRKVVSQRLVLWDFLLPALFFNPTNGIESETLMKKHQIFKFAGFNNRNLQCDLPGHMVCVVIHLK